MRKLSLRIIFFQLMSEEEKKRNMKFFYGRLCKIDEICQLFKICTCKWKKSTCILFLLIFIREPPLKGARYQVSTDECMQ